MEFKYNMSTCEAKIIIIITRSVCVKGKMKINKKINTAYI